MKPYLSILRRQERPARFLAARLLVATGLCRLFTVQQRGYKLRFDGSNLATQLWINPFFREEALEFFRRYLKPGDVVVDVGANIGDTVITSALAVGGEGRVFGIEAHPRTFQRLKENLLLNGISNVVPIHSAVGSTFGWVQLSDNARDDMNAVGEGSLKVPIQLLDNMVPAGCRVALLKIDVEGYEKFVVEGAGNVLWRTDCVFFEVSEAHFQRFGYTTLDLLDLLRGFGFSIYKFSGATALAHVPGDHQVKGYDNLIAVREPSLLAKRTACLIT